MGAKKDPASRAAGRVQIEHCSIQEHSENSHIQSAPQDWVAEIENVGIETPSRRNNKRSRNLPNFLCGAVEDDQGRVVPNVANAAMALRHASDLSGAFVGYDEFNLCVMVLRSLPQAEGAMRRQTDLCPRNLSDADVVGLQEWLQHMGLPKIGVGTVGDAVNHVARENKFHPVRNYLNSLKWDRKKRLDSWLSRYLGAEFSRYTSEIGAMFLRAAVARIFKPGSKADYLLVLEGPQGGGKSRACQILGGKWFTDNIPDISQGKEASQHLRGKWFCEVAELASVNRVEAERVKAFVSRQDERYRPPYGREDVVEPRQCVFIGTTNQDKYLRDATGARRFWPVKVGGIDLKALAKDRDQLFAEAVEDYRARARWWPDPQFEREFVLSEQESRFEVDAWEEAIEPYLAEKARVQVLEIAVDVLGLGKGDTGTTAQRRIGKILHRLGWTSIRDSRGRGYVRGAT